MAALSCTSKHRLLKVFAGRACFFQTGEAKYGIRRSFLIAADALTASGSQELGELWIVKGLCLNRTAIGFDFLVHVIKPKRGSKNWPRLNFLTVRLSAFDPCDNGGSRGHKGARNIFHHVSWISQSESHPATHKAAPTRF